MPYRSTHISVQYDITKTVDKIDRNEKIFAKENGIVFANQELIRAGLHSNSANSEHVPYGVSQKYPSIYFWYIIVYFSLAAIPFR